jgi:hypothetical protein
LDETSARLLSRFRLEEPLFKPKDTRNPGISQEKGSEKIARKLKN